MLKSNPLVASVPQMPVRRWWYLMVMLGALQACDSGNGSVAQVEKQDASVLAGKAYANAVVATPPELAADQRDGGRMSAEARSATKIVGNIENLHYFHADSSIAEPLGVATFAATTADFPNPDRGFYG